MKLIKKGFTLIELLIAIAIIAIMAGVIFVVSNYGLKRARLSSALQTVRSAIPNMADCYLKNLALSPPNDINNPNNIPCAGNSTVYRPLGTYGSSGCIYNTAFVATDGAIVIANGAIQAGCDCSGGTIATCVSVFQCNFATDGKCRGNDIAN